VNTELNDSTEARSDMNYEAGVSKEIRWKCYEMLFNKKILTQRNKQEYVI